MAFHKLNIEWKIYCNSSPDKIFTLISSDEGRKKFWAESSIEKDGVILFVFPNKQIYSAAIIESKPSEKFCLNYFDSQVIFLLAASEDGGTDVTLMNEGVTIEEHDEIKAGWVSVLLALKTYADFGIDIRNHNSKRTWDEKYVDN